MSEAPCTIWSDDNYNGVKTDIRYGSYSSIVDIGGKPNTMSSIKIADWTKVELYSEFGFAGTKIVLTGPLTAGSMRPHGFNDKLRSIKVTYIEPPFMQKLACCRGQADGYCGKFIAGSAACNEVNLQYCPYNMHEAQCKDWVDRNPALGDNAVLTWCKSRPTDPYCSCIYSVAKSKFGVNPKCIDDKCIRYGYTPSAMRIPCPNVISCEMQVNMANSGVQIGSNVNLAQNCGNTTTTAAAKPNTSTTLSSANGSTTVKQVALPPPAQPQSNTWTILLAFFFFVLIIVASLGIYYVMKKPTVIKKELFD
jgi:hypothetical protein